MEARLTGPTRTRFRQVVGSEIRDSLMSRLRAVWEAADPRISQADIAEEVGLGRKKAHAIATYLKPSDDPASREPTIDMIARIAEALGQRLDVALVPSDFASSHLVDLGVDLEEDDLELLREIARAVPTLTSQQRVTIRGMFAIIRGEGG